jgi:hypothetical protein
VRKRPARAKPLVKGNVRSGVATDEESACLPVVWISFLYGAAGGHFKNAINHLRALKTGVKECAIATLGACMARMDRCRWAC